MNCPCFLEILLVNNRTAHTAQISKRIVVSASAYFIHQTAETTEMKGTGFIRWLPE